MDMEIAQSIEGNLAPWFGAWNDLQASELLRADAYQKTLTQYSDAVRQYTVRRLSLSRAGKLTNM